METSRSAWLTALLFINAASSCSNLCAAHLFRRLYLASRAASLLGLLLLSVSEFAFDLSFLAFTLSNLFSRVCEGSTAAAPAGQLPQPVLMQQQPNWTTVAAAVADEQPLRMWLCVATFAPSNAGLFIRNWWITALTLARCVVIVWPFSARTLFTKKLYGRCYCGCLVLSVAFTALRVWAAFESNYHLLRLVMILQAPVPSLLVFAASVVMVTDLTRTRCCRRRLEATAASAVTAATAPCNPALLNHHQQQQQQQQQPQKRREQQQEQQQQPQKRREQQQQQPQKRREQQQQQQQQQHHGGANSTVIRATITIASVAVLFVLLETPCSIFVFMGWDSSLTEHVSNTLIGLDSMLNFVIFLATSCTFREEFLSIFRRRSSST